MAFTVPRWISAPVGRVAQTAGRTYDYLTPAQDTSKLTKIGRSITDLNQVYTGGGLDNKASFVQVNRAPAGTTYNPVNAPRPDGTTPGETAADNGSWGSGGGTGAVNTFDRNGYIAQLQQKWTDLGSILNDIYSQVDTLTKDRRSQLDASYKTQEDQIANDYANVAGKTASAYAGRGLADSSYVGEAQDANLKTYNNTIDSIANDKTAKYAELGKYNTQQKSGVDAMRNQYNQAFGALDQYDNQGLVDLGTQIDASNTSASGQRAGLGTDSEYVKKLNAVAPVQQQGSAQLQARLQNIIASTAPVGAKKQIAKGLIKAATLNDPDQSNYWNTQFETLLASAGQ